MRIYLDADVHPGVKAYLEGKGYVAHRAHELGLAGLDDGPAYVEAVRRGYDLIVTCNVQGPGAFHREARRYLRCEPEELPVPIHKLWEPGIGNRWSRLRFRFRRHSRRLKRLARELEYADAERRHREALATLGRLLRRAGRGEAGPLDRARGRAGEKNPAEGREAGMV